MTTTKTTPVQLATALRKSSDEQVRCARQRVAFSIRPRQEDALDLNSLTHEKAHVLRHGERLPVLDRRIKRVVNTAVYRGLSAEDFEHIKRLKLGDTLTLPTYWSATESKQMAEGFGEMYGTNTVVEFDRLRGFCLWRWSVADLRLTKRDDPETYSNIDGDFLLEHIEHEREWVLGLGYKLTVTAVANGIPSKLSGDL